MLEHEKAHFATFQNWLTVNSTRPCNALGLWSLGGFILGLLTALLGRKSIWVCTRSVESTVLHHLNYQLDYLESQCRSAYEAVLGIKNDEEAHHELGKEYGSDSILYSPIVLVVTYATRFAIWLSTKL